MISYLIMIAGSIGLQYFNNKKAQENNRKIQQKRHDFLKLNAEEDIERKIRIMEETNQLREEIDWELHKQRCEDISSECDRIVQRIAKMADVSTWPLSVLPMVMKNESFGTYIGGQNESIAVHCLLTPPDSDNSSDTQIRRNFMDNVIEGVDSTLEKFCNYYWNTLSTHPIIYYGKAWKRTVEVNNVKINQLRTDLRSLPTVVFTPKFKDHKLILIINLWGMGKELSQEVDLAEVFNKTYTDEFDYIGNAQQVIDDLVPYLQAVMGFLTDSYFWKMYSITPMFPGIVAQMEDGDYKNKLRGYIAPIYKELFEEEITLIREQDVLCLPPSIYLEYLHNVRPILDDYNFQEKLEALLLAIAHNRGVELSEQTIGDSFSHNVFLPSEIEFVKQFFYDYHKREEKYDVEELTKDNFTMKAGGYSEKRDELISIMNDILKIEGLSEKRINEFRRIRKKCLEDQFNMVLIGEFQGGKSTTFNALCGGREISPRGAMIKTSACPITATNISEPEAEEFALVQWKTDAELLMNIQGLLNKYISPEDTDYDPESKELFEPYKYLSLSNSNHVDLIKKAIEKEWEKINNAPTYYNDERDICRIADIVLHFYDDPEVKKIKEGNVIDIDGEKRTICSIEEVSRIAVFPDDWERRAGQGASAFNAEEVLFAFVGGIDCYIHSKNLERLGCSVTDCPGLFTSVWDTQVAFNTMPRADAVIYLLSGTKQMTDGDKKALSYIKNLETIEEKLFFTINTRAGEKVTNNIIETDKSIIESLGFRNVQIRLLNSQLFFLGEFGHAYLENRLDEYSKERFQIVSEKFDIDEENLEGCWLSAVDDALHQIKKHHGIDALDFESVDSVIQISNYRDVFSNIETYIIDKKAYSILIQSGANIVIKSLTEIEGELTRQENDALKDVAACEAEFASAQQALDVFQDEARAIISDAFPEDVVSVITSRAYDKIIRNEKTLVRLSIKASQKLVPVLGAKCKAIAFELKLLETGLKLNLPLDESAEKIRQKLRDIIEPVVKGVLENELGGNITEWVTNVVKGEDRDYKAQMIPKLDELSRKLNDKWESCVQQNASIEAFKLSPPADNFEELSKVSGGIEIQGGSVVGEGASLAFKTLIGEIIAQLVAIVMGLITMLLSTTFLDLGLTAFVTAIVYLVSWLAALTHGIPQTNDNAQTREELNKGEKRLYDAIFPIMTQQLNKDETIKAIRNGLAELPNTIIQKYKDYYLAQLTDQQEGLQEDIRKRRENKQKSLDKQQEIAEKAKDLRKNHIQPMRRRVESFVLSCKSENVEPQTQKDAG